MLGRVTLVLFCVALLGCGGGGASIDAAPQTPPVIGSDSCPDLSCLPCSRGEMCAAQGPFLDGTCCAIGDDLVRLGGGETNEAVDIEVQDGLAMLCGGFGGFVFDVSVPQVPVRLGPIGGRCQRMAFGPTLADGRRVFYVAHHGDSRAVFPFLLTWQLATDGTLTLMQQKEETGVLYEGMASTGNALYVAAHAGGVRVYEIDAQGVPAYRTTVNGMTNAWKIVVAGGVAYVADHEAGVHVLSLADPLAPTLLRTVATSGRPRDVAVEAGRMYVALGSSGVDVFDITDAQDPTGVVRIDALGSVQAVHAEGNMLALASWTHTALYDTRTFDRLATERVLGPLEQDLGVSIADGNLFVAEWGTGLHVLRYRPGYVAPDLWIDEGVYSFRGDRADARAVIIRNRGLVELRIGSIGIDDPDYTAERQTLSVLPGQAQSFELTHVPAGGGSEATMTLDSDDPDQARLRIPLRVGDATLVKVGDTLDDRFGFLDPNGAGQVSGLDGKVTLLAYFGVW